MPQAVGLIQRLKHTLGQRQTAWVIGALLLTVLIRAPFFRWPLTEDEGGYAYTATWWFRGLTLYSRQLWLDRPQAIFVAYRLGMGLLGTSTEAIRQWAAVWATGTGLFVYALGSHLFGQRTGVVSALLYALFSASPNIQGFTANAEVFMLLPATASAFFLIRQRPAWAGAFASLAILLKPSGISAVVLAVLWMIYTRVAVRQLIRFSLSALPLLLLCVVHGAATVGWQAFLYAMGGSRLQIQQGNTVARALFTTIYTMPTWLPPFAVGFWGHRRLPHRASAFLLFWLIGSIAGMSLGGRWFEHYFMQLIPLLSIYAAHTLVNLTESRSLRRFIAASLLLATMVTIIGSYIALSPEDGARWLFHDLYNEHGTAIAAYLKTHTTEDETVYVAFWGAHVYYLAERRSAVPYLYRVHIMNIPGAYDQIVALVQNRIPAYVVTSQMRLPQMDPDERLWQALARNYEVEATIDSVQLQRRR